MTAPALIALSLIGVVFAFQVALSEGVLGALAWVVTGYFVLGTIVNLISRSPRERWWAPVALVLAVSVGLLAVSSRRTGPNPALPATYGT